MSDSGQQRERHVSRDRETIRRWAQDHDAVPVRESTEGGTSQFRLVPERRLSDDQERAEWDAFFEEFEDGEQVVVYHDKAETEPFEVANREEVITRLDDEEIEERLLEGETVTSEITETTVVESVVTEELTVESELVDRERTNQRVVDAELVDRECTACTFVESTDVDQSAGFDADRYLAQVGTGTTGAGTDQMRTDRTDADRSDRTDTDRAETGRIETDRTDAERRDADRADTDRTEIEMTDEWPYSLELDVDETWSVTREFREEFVVESRITGAEVTEADSIEDHAVDVEGLHRSIVKSGLIEEDRSPDEVVAAYDVESELAEEDRVQTSFSRDRVVEDEIVDRKRVRADVTGGEYLDMMTISTRKVASEQGTATDRGTAASGETVRLTDDLVDKDVVDATGDDVGTVASVDEAGDRIYVDAHQGLGERIKRALGWGDKDDDYALDANAIERVTDDQVELKREEHLSDEDR